MKQNTREICFTHPHPLVGTLVEEIWISKTFFYFSRRGEHIHLSRLSDSSMPLQELPSHSQRFSMPASPCSSAYSFDLQVAGYCMRHTVENPMPRLSSKQLISLYTVQYITDCSNCVHMSWSEATENFKLLFFLEHFSQTNSHHSLGCPPAQTDLVPQRRKSANYFRDSRSSVDLLGPYRRCSVFSLH